MYLMNMKVVFVFQVYIPCTKSQTRQKYCLDNHYLLWSTNELIGVEYSRVRDSTWMYFTFPVTIRTVVELVDVQGYCPTPLGVGLQQYSARTFHVTLSLPDYIRAGRDPSKADDTHQTTPKVIQTTHWTQSIMLRWPEPIQIFVFLAPSRSDLGESLPTINLLGVYLGELSG